MENPLEDVTSDGAVELASVEELADPSLYSLRIDEAQVVVAAYHSNTPQDGAILVDDSIYRDASLRVGRVRYVDGALLDYAPPPPPVDLAAYAKRMRDEVENGGIVMAGIPIATDDRSKVLVLGARRRAEKDPTITTLWAAEDGNTYPLTAGMVIGISDAIGDHVDACFSVYVEVRAAIAARTITTPGQIDAAFSALRSA